MADHSTVLVRVTGPDRSGIVAILLGILAEANAEIQDIEQIVIRGHISLSLVVGVPEGRDLLRELLLYGWEHELEVEFEVVGDEPTPRSPGEVITVLGQTLSPADLHAVTAAIAETGANIDRIERLSRFPAWSYQLLVSGGDQSALKSALLLTAIDRPDLDIAIQPEGLARRAQRLVVLDVDSTLVQNEMIDLLADVAGCGDEVAAITESAMQGHLDFEQSLRARVALLAGQPVEIIDRAWERLDLTPGARTFVRTLRRLGLKIAIVSGGFTSITDRLVDELDLDFGFANTLDIRRGVLTGQVKGDIVDRERKAKLLLELATAEGLSPSQVIAVGDGANDVAMLEAAGLGIAFNAKQAARDAADTEVNVPYLDAVLFLLGVRREDIEHADAQDG